MEGRRDRERNREGKEEGIGRGREGGRERGTLAVLPQLGDQSSRLSPLGHLRNDTATPRELRLFHNPGELHASNLGSSPH